MQSLIMKLVPGLIASGAQSSATQHRKQVEASRSLKWCNCVSCLQFPIRLSVLLSVIVHLRCSFIAHCGPEADMLGSIRAGGVGGFIYSAECLFCCTWYGHSPQRPTMGRIEYLHYNRHAASDGTSYFFRYVHLHTCSWREFSRWVIN